MRAQPPELVELALVHPVLLPQVQPEPEGGDWKRMASMGRADETLVSAVFQIAFGCLRFATLLAVLILYDWMMAD